MRRQLGETRSVIHEKHALICPDSHEITPMPNWLGSETVFVITPDLGAKFTQFFVTMPIGAIGESPVRGVERFVLVLEGEVSLETGDSISRLISEGYALIPADMAHEIKATKVSRIIVLERIFIPLDGVDKPKLIVGQVSEQPSMPMTDDGQLEVKKLLPLDVKFDCEVNVMHFKPGGSLPYVETHFVEHGLLMLNGGGIYRLGDDWYSVEAGDTIWMAPFCEQWFGAIGKNAARYLIYKNWNRDPLSFA
jgi:(S)-ureidoglycine aminohydrolase